VAKMHDMPADGTAVDQVVERRDRIPPVDRPAEQVGDAEQRMVRHPTPPALHDLARIDAGRPRAIVVGERALDPRGSPRRQQRRLRYAHRSTSAITKSMLPRIAIKSAIKRPCEISGSTCRCGNDGVRIRSRYGMVPPSLMA